MPSREDDVAGAKTTPRVSICIPTYNLSACLRQSMASVLAQTYGDFELVIVDDCSADDTADAVRSFDDPRVRYVRNEHNLGIMGNYNRCLELAAGEYVSILCHDDLWEPDYLERAAGLLDEHPNAGFVYTAMSLIDADGGPMGESKPLPSDEIFPGRQLFDRLANFRFEVFISSVLCRRSLYDEVGAFDPSMDTLCDWEMFMRLSFHTDVGYISAPLLRYRCHSNNATVRFYAGQGAKGREGWTWLRRCIERGLVTAGEYAGAGEMRKRRRKALATARLGLAGGYKLVGRRRAACRQAIAAISMDPTLLSRSGPAALDLTLAWIHPSLPLKVQSLAVRLRHAAGVVHLPGGIRP